MAHIKLKFPSGKNDCIATRSFDFSKDVVLLWCSDVLQGGCWGDFTSKYHKRSLIDTQPQHEHFKIVVHWSAASQIRGSLDEKCQLETCVLILGFFNCKADVAFWLQWVFQRICFLVHIYIYIYFIYNLFSIVAFSVDMGYLVVSVRFTIILRTHIEWPDAFFLQQLFGSAFVISSVKGLHPRKIFKKTALLEARLKQLQRDDPIAWQVSKDNGGVDDMEQSILSCITYHKWCRSWQVQQSAYRCIHETNVQWMFPDDICGASLLRLCSMIHLKWKTWNIYQQN